MSGATFQLGMKLLGQVQHFGLGQNFEMGAKFLVGREILGQGQFFFRLNTGRVFFCATARLRDF